MAWIESHQTLASHPKTRKAARALGIPTVNLIGHLHCLWHWALDLAEDGDLSKFDAEDIAIAAQWEGDSQQLVDALLDCGFGDGPGFLERNGSYGDPQQGLTGSLVLHDWWAYAGKLVARRQQDRERKAARRSAANTQDVPGTSDGPPADGQGSAGSREPDSTEPTEPDQTEQDLKTFGDTYPRKDGMKWGGTSRKEVLKSWSKLSDEQRQHALVGAKHYADYVLQPGAPIVAMATTWLNQQRWEQFQQPRFVEGQSRASPNGKGGQYADRYRQAAAELERQGR
jgi:hypothetical protein